MISTKRNIKIAPLFVHYVLLTLFSSSNFYGTNSAFKSRQGHVQASEKLIKFYKLLRSSNARTFHEEAKTHEKSRKIT